MAFLDIGSEISQVEMCLQDMFPSLAPLSSSLKSDVIKPDLPPLESSIGSRESTSPSSQKSYSGVPAHVDATRPPYSFLDLTIMAIRNYPNNEASVQEIYDFISTSFPFFRDNILHWRNSVRHNLTVRPCFERKVYESNSVKRIVWRYVESSSEETYNSFSEDGLLTPPPTPIHPKKDATIIPVSVFPLITAPIQISPSAITPPASPIPISPSDLETLRLFHNTPASDENTLPKFAELWAMVSSRPSLEALRSLHQQQNVTTMQSGGNFLEESSGNSACALLIETDLVDLGNGLQEMELNPTNTSSSLVHNMKFPIDGIMAKKGNLLPPWALEFPLITRP